MRIAETYTVGETFRSKNGAGPWTALLTSVDGQSVLLHQVVDGGNELRVSRLEMWFLSSPACGWKRVDDRATREIATYIQQTLDSWALEAQIAAGESPDTMEEKPKGSKRK